MNVVSIPISDNRLLPVEVLSRGALAAVATQCGVHVARLDGGPQRRLQADIGHCQVLGLLIPDDERIPLEPVELRPIEDTLLINFSNGPSIDVCLERSRLLVLLPLVAFDHVPGRWQLAASPVEKGVQAIADDPTMRHLCLALLSKTQSSSTSSVGSAVFERSIASAMLAHFLKRYCPIASARSGGIGIRLEPWQLRVAEEAMLASLDQPLGIPAIASRCGVSVVHFSRAFRRTTSETPCRWLMRRRIERACSMLVETQECIADIALACGFSDQSHLTRTFASVLGKTPGAWRTSLRLAHQS